MIGYIYLTTNLINGKKYIGKRQSAVFDSKYKGSGKYLVNAISKYGWDNFSCESLQECSTVEELNAAEKLFIEKFDAVSSPTFYNIAAGGEGGDTGGSYKGMPGHLQSQAEREKRSISLKLAYAEGRHPIVRKGYPKGKKRSELDRLANIERNKSRVWITKDNVQKTVDKSMLDSFLSDGWSRGRCKSSKPAWNKGLTKETDSRLQAVSQSRKKLFELGPVGCFGLKGSQNFNSKHS